MGKKEEKNNEEDAPIVTKFLMAISVMAMFIAGFVLLSLLFSSLNYNNSSEYNCFNNTYDCSDFITHKEAQRVYESCGGINNDIHNLDEDKDGLACELLQ